MLFLTPRCVISLKKQYSGMPYILDSDFVCFSDLYTNVLKCILPKSVCKSFLFILILSECIRMKIIILNTIDTCLRVFKRNKTDRIYICVCVCNILRIYILHMYALLYEDTYYKEGTHTIMGANKSQDLQSATDPRELKPLLPV